VFFVGTLSGWFPFAQFLGLGEDVKVLWEKKVGSPPWGHAEESTLKRFSRGMEDYVRLETNKSVSIDPDAAVAELRKAGYAVDDANEKLIDIARENSTTPQALSDVILRAARAAEDSRENEPTDPFPTPASGLGRMTLEEYAARYDLDLESMIRTLKAGGRDIDPKQKLKDETARLGTDPHALIEYLNSSAAGE